MISTILIDDEQDSLQSLELDIKAYCPQINVLTTCQYPEQGIKMIKSLQPDLIFLDIGMPGMNGFELLQQFDNINFDVIFVTAFDEYAIKAFEFNAIDYLLKPVMESKLVAAIDKVVQRQEHIFGEEKLSALLTNIQMQQGVGLENIALPIGEGYEFVHFSQIVYLQADNNYTWVHLQDGKKHLVSKTLKDMEKMFSGAHFYRVHKSYFVNLNMISKYIRGNGGFLIMSNNDKITVSRQKKSDLMQLLHIS